MTHTDDTTDTRLPAGSIRIGDNPATSNPVHLPPGFTYLWGQRGSGTTTLTHNITAAGLADPGTVVWLIDPDGRHDTARTSLKPLLDGDTEQPGPNWVAVTMGEAVAMAAAAVDLAKHRHGSLYPDAWGTTTMFATHPPRVHIIVASGVRGFNDGDDGDAQEVVQHLIRLAGVAPYAGISVTIAGKQPPGRALPAALRRHIDTYIAVGVVFADDLLPVFGSGSAGMPVCTVGQALVGNTDTVQPCQLDRSDPSQLLDVVRTHEQPAIADEALTGSQQYLTRWVRALPYLVDDAAAIPPRLVKLGQPQLPDSVTAATTAQLVYALRTSPSAAGDAQAAAAEILIAGCDGRLLDSAAVRDTMAIASGVLYVRWSKLPDVAKIAESDYMDDGNEMLRHPDAGILLRLAAHLGTGGLTADSAHTIRAALHNM